MLNDEIESWLLTLPVDEPVDIDGESVYLKVHSYGAELGVYLGASSSDAEVDEALRVGFRSALHFDAGLALSEEGDMLLTQWLPDVDSWVEAADALENILNQTSMWRAALSPGKPEPTDFPERNEERIRNLFLGKMS